MTTTEGKEERKEEREKRRKVMLLAGGGSVCVWQEAKGTRSERSNQEVRRPVSAPEAGLAWGGPPLARGPSLRQLPAHQERATAN